MGAYLDSQVSGAFSFRDPSESDLRAPVPSIFFLAGPNGDQFMPIDFGSRGLAKYLEDTSSPIHVGGGTFEV
jgi:hypothetical protein